MTFKICREEKKKIDIRHLWILISQPLNISQAPSHFFSARNTGNMTTLHPIEEHELKTLAGKTIIVTGGASGIGRATVLLAHGK